MRATTAQALIGKWREMPTAPDAMFGGCYSRAEIDLVKGTLKRCADELDAALRAEPVSPQGTGEALLDSMRAFYGLPPDATVKDFLDAAKAEQNGARRIRESA